MSVLSVMEPRADEPRTRKRGQASDTDGQKAPWWEAAAATWRTGRDDDADYNQGNLITGYNALADQLIKLGRPASRYGRDRTTLSGSPQDVSAELYPQLWADLEEARKTNPTGFGNYPGKQADFEKWARGRMGARQADQAVAARGGFGSSLVPSLAQGLTKIMEPEQLIQIPMGGGGTTIAGTLLRQGLAGAIGAGIDQPNVAKTRLAMGEELTSAEMDQNMALGAVIQSGQVAAHVGAVKLGEAVAGKVPNPVPLGYRVGRAAMADVNRASDGDVARAFDTAFPSEFRTPDQQAALHVVTRDGEIDASSPYRATYAGGAIHRERLADATAQLTGDAAPRRAIPQGAGAIDTMMARIRRVESAGNDGASNPRSSAQGRYQFTDGTWLQTYKARFGAGESNAAILAKKFDPALQDRLMRDLTAGNAAALQRAGIETTPGNLYLAHFAGEAGARKLHAAAPDAPVEAVLGARVVEANPFLRGKSASEAIAWADRKMGGGRETVGGSELAARPRDDGGDELLAALGDERADIELRRLRTEQGLADPADSGAIHLPELPELRRADFPNETEWRLEQAASDARMLGADPVVTRQSVWMEARDRLIEQRAGEVEGALYHPDVGPINVKWGDASGGLAHIVQKHEEVLEDLPALIAGMVVDAEKSSANRLHLESDDHLAKVRLDFDGQAQRWLLTAYRKDGKASPAAEDGRAAGGARDGSPTREAATDIAGFRENGNLPAEWVARGPDGAVLARGTSRPEVARIARRTEGASVRAEPAPSMTDHVIETFSDPVGPAVQAQVDGLMHDMKNSIDAGETAGIAFAVRDGIAESAELASAALDADDAALAAIRGCL